jgi:hypothetical protein
MIKVYSLGFMPGLTALIDMLLQVATELLACYKFFLFKEKGDFFINLMGFDHLMFFNYWEVTTHRNFYKEAR